MPPEPLTQPRRIHGQGDWYWVNKEIIEQYGKVIKPIGIAIYSCLANLANRESFCFPSHEFIARQIGASVSSVQRGIRLLEKCGLIKIQRKRYSNTYHLLKPVRSN